MTEFCQLWLTCKDKAEADMIASALLERRLVVCAKQIPITADFWWEQVIDHAKEILLVMESKLSDFETIEKEVVKLHSYDTFVLQAIPLAKVSRGATQWMETYLNHEQ